MPVQPQPAPPPHARRPWVPRAAKLALFAAALATVLWATLAPSRDLPSVNLWDKAEHAVAYFGLTFLGVWALPHRRLIIAGGLVQLGILVEVAQALMDLGRQGDPRDAVANGVGVGLGLAAALAARAALHWLWPRLLARLSPPVRQEG